MDYDKSLKEEELEAKRILARAEERFNKQKETVQSLQQGLRASIRQTLSDPTNKNNIARDLLTAQRDRPFNGKNMQGFQNKSEEIVTGFEEKKYSDADFFDDDAPTTTRFKFPTRRF